MLIVDDKLVSEEILDIEFVCDLNACKGACCVQGDSGAPLSEVEANKLEDDLEYIKPFLSEGGVSSIEAQGVFVIDEDGDMVTPLREGKECAYTVFNGDGTALCGIEKAWKAGKTDFQKPLSCHLYPIRVAELKEYTALNYHKWQICSPACECGAKLKVPVYAFLKEPLIRAYGEKWYEELKVAAEAWREYGLQNEE